MEYLTKEKNTTRGLAQVQNYDGWVILTLVHLRANVILFGYMSQRFFNPVAAFI